MSPDDHDIGTEAAASIAGSPGLQADADAERADEATVPDTTGQLEMAMELDEPVVAEPETAEPEPETAEQAVPVAADAALVEGVSGGLTWIPFASYLGLWVVLAGLTAYLLAEATADVPARWTPVYVPLIWAGVGLTALGPILSLVVWLVARARRPKAGRRGLFASAMTRGALVAFFGVAIWLATLFVLEILASRGAL